MWLRFRPTRRPSLTVTTTVRRTISHPRKRTQVFLKFNLGGRTEKISIDRLKPAYVDKDQPVVEAQPRLRGRPQKQKIPITEADATPNPITTIRRSARNKAHSNNLVNAGSWGSGVAVIEPADNVASHDVTWCWWHATFARCELLQSHDITRCEWISNRGLLQNRVFIMNKLMQIRAQNVENWGSFFARREN